jgi:hypothetical protein
MNMKQYALLFAALSLGQFAMAQSGISVLGAVGGSPKSAFASVGALAGLGIGTENRLVLGGGVRTTLAHTSDREFDAINPVSGASGLTVHPTKFNSLNGALFVWASFVVVRHVQIGYNVDIVGGTTGKQINGNLNDEFHSQVQVTPVSTSVIALSKKDMGLLQSEFFVGYEIMPKAWLRAGVAHQHIEVRAKSKPEGQERFGGFLNSFFVGISLPLGQAAPVVAQ